MVARLEGDAGAEWRQRWPVVLAACAGMAVTTINTYSLGVFMQPLEQEFGWTRAQISTGHAIAAVATIVLAPFLGVAIDRFGPRRIGLFGVSMLCILTALLSRAGPDIASWNAIWAALALMTVFILPSIWTAAVASFFSAGRGLAFAVVLCGSGLSSIVTPMLAYELIENFGWRTAYVALAGIWAAVTLPLLLFFFTSKTDLARRHPQAAARSRAPIDPLRSGLISPRFLQLAIATLLIASVVVTLAVSLVPVLSSNGLTRAEAAAAAALLGIASITGRLTSGYLLDRMEGRFLAAFAVSMPILACAILILAPGSVFAATAAVLIIGAAMGAELDFVAYLTSRYFKLENFGLLFGTLTGVTTFAAGFGPLALNIVYDNVQSYIPALWAAFPMCALSALLFFLLGPYPNGASAVPGQPDAAGEPPASTGTDRGP